MTSAPARTIPLRDYQQQALDAIIGAYSRGVTRQLVSLPTGAGKTFLAAHLVRTVASTPDWRTVFMVHRDELATQSMRALQQINPDLRVGLVKAGNNDLAADMMVVSAQTLAREARLSQVVDALASRSTLFISDECHHDRADSRTRIIESIAPALLVGLTATPKRGDGQGLDRIYQEVVFHLPMLDLMRQGRLAPLKGVRVETGINLDDVRVRAGEFVEADLAGAVNTPDRNRIIVESWQKHASGRRRTVVFAVDVEHALAVRDAFREAGVTSEVVLGETGPEERAAILRDFHAGKIQVLSNCMVLTEGYDEPAIDCIIMARPTKSQGLYIQCVGRGARTSPEKEDCLVVDVADNTARHTLVAFLDLAGEEKQAGAKMPVGTPQGILDIVAEAEAIRVRREIEVDLFGRSPVLWHRRGTSESFFAPAASTEDANAWVTVIEYDGGFMPAIVTQSRARGAAPVVKHLFDRAVDIEIAKGIAEDAVEKSPLTRRDAAWRRRNDPPSDAQLRFARSLGARVPQGATKADVASLIDEQLFVRAMRKAGIA